MQQLQRCLTLKIVRFPNIVFFMVTSNSMLANPTFLSYLRSVFSVIPYICEMDCPANVIMMVADVLAPNRHQCIANHHRDSSSISGFKSSPQHNIHIPLRPLNKQYLREVGSSATCCWQWVHFLHELRLIANLCWAHIIAIPSIMITLVEKIIVFGTNFMSSLAILQHSSLFLTIKFGKIKWRFSCCNRFHFSLSIKMMHLWHFVLSCNSYMWFNEGFWLSIHPVFCIAWAELREDK